MFWNQEKDGFCTFSVFVSLFEDCFRLSSENEDTERKKSQLEEVPQNKYCGERAFTPQLEAEKTLYLDPDVFFFKVLRSYRFSKAKK